MTDEITKIYYRPGEVAKMFKCSVQWVYFRSVLVGICRNPNRERRYTKKEIEKMFAYRNSLIVKEKEL